ncbi:invasion associated locus B family protein [Anianabacter salinae]|uniref:invasion associated locus B family protein n=1 Tax=Anianabacter salinae TaxID=2851023 RepID=UPI003898F688
MTDILKPLSLAFLIAFAAPAIAQDETADPAPDATSAPNEEQSDPLALSMGEDQAELGQVYVAETFTDWEMRCVRTEAENDPCQLYQLLDDGQGNAVAEFNMFVLPEGNEAAAGATIVTPLETLLTSQITLVVDESQPRRYPFSWCAQIGCFARVGFTGDEVAQFKAGQVATLSIVPVAAPDQRVNISVSLSGFTAAYDALAARPAPQPPAPGEAPPAANE